MRRRTFVKTLGTAGAAAVAMDHLLWANEPLERVAGLPRRPLGRTGQKISVVGFPGLAFIHYEQSQCDASVKSAFEKGINYFDVAPAYGKGQCETKLGIALQGLPRDEYFLACKTKKRDKEGARLELEESLRLLKTDRFDLYQLHHLVKPSEVKEALGPGGAMEAILQAKKEGKVRWIGFSAHTTNSAVEVMKGFKFDTVMFPINFVEYYTRGFGKEVITLANEQGAGILAIKPLSWGTWPKDAKRTREWWYKTVETPEEIELAMRFALSQKMVASAVPTAFLELFDRTVEAARKFKPLDADAIAKLQEMAANQGSIFLREEQSVAANTTHGCDTAYPENPQRLIA